MFNYLDFRVQNPRSFKSFSNSNWCENIKQQKEKRKKKRKRKNRERL